MGISVSSDVCENVLQLDKQLDNFFGDDSHGDRFGDWLCVGTGAECGRKNRLYGNVFVVTSDSYDDFESQFDDNTSNEDWDNTIKQYQHIFLVYGDYDECGSVFSSDLKSVEKFKSDFGFLNDIEDLGSITQSI